MWINVKQIIVNNLFERTYPLNREYLSAFFYLFDVTI